MSKGLFHIALSAISFHKKQVLYQAAIISILTMVITGSLLTGFSVRKSLKSRIDEKIGNTGVIVTSGLRFFGDSLASGIAMATGSNSTPILEAGGICQNFSSGKKENRVSIIGIKSDFFSFQGFEEISIPEGSVAVNQNLASRVNIKKGDEVIVTVNPLSDIPPSSPFAPSANQGLRKVFRVDRILPPDSCGNFSLSISQIPPLNVFINSSELPGMEDRSNRILIENKPDTDTAELASLIRNILTLRDAGLSVRYSEKTQQTELISSRVFIDTALLNNVEKVITDAVPCLTYLVNSISFETRSTPYSFVSAIDHPGFVSYGKNDGIIINRWMADDLGVKEGDTVAMEWYDPGIVSELETKNGKYVVVSVTGFEGLAADSLLMPAFPGISGKESCSEWDAGVEIDLEAIREKDEGYWNNYRGTPKGFIKYAEGKRIWGNNFGPATAIRFAPGIKPADVKMRLKGNLDPFIAGLTIRSLRADMSDAASRSVDFSSLFLGLGFFIIISALFLFVLSLRAWFNSRKKDVYILYALGFSRKRISALLLTEAGIISSAGIIAGVFAGLVFNHIMISSLNSVWKGAVQTDMMRAFTGVQPVITGLFSSLIISFATILLIIRSYLKKLDEKSEKHGTVSFPKSYFSLLLVFLVIALVLLILQVSTGFSSVGLSFITGGSVFVTLALLWRYLISSGKWYFSGESGKIRLTQYHRFNPGKLLIPVLLLSSGLFAIVITGINRMQAGESGLMNAGGTGGYQIWMETTSGIKENLQSEDGIKKYGLEDFKDKFSVVRGYRSLGDDASCLNLNYIASPPLLGIDPDEFIKNRSFSFSSLVKEADTENPWGIIKKREKDNIIFGFADQTVLEWGLKKKTGDTLEFRTESGALFRLVIAGGMKSSVFQGSIVTSAEYLNEFYPSIPGSSVFLFKCEEGIVKDLSDILRTRFEPFGGVVTTTAQRLEEFFVVTNTYLTVFTILGGFGIILGIAGLGLVLLSNFNTRKKEYALMKATGYTDTDIRKMLMHEQYFIIVTGVITGFLPGVISTLPSIISGGEVQWISLGIIVTAVILTGIISILISIREAGRIRIAEVLKKD